MKFRFIEAEKARYPVRLLCRVLDVSRSGYYAARRRPESERSRRDRQLQVAVRAAHAASRRSYGSPRLHRELTAQGHAVGRHRVARLMREEGLRGRRRRRFRRTTKANPNHPVATNELARCFHTTAPNQAWVSDISYLWTSEGWLYLAVVIDLYSRRVVGWAMGERIDQALTLRALEMALTGRKPATPCLHHSDRGSQYTARAYRCLLEVSGIRCSMSRKGDCWDNAVAESFFATLKVELVREACWTTRAEAASAVFDYIESFYNQRRRHSYLGYLSPAEFERKTATGVAERLN